MRKWYLLIILVLGLGGNLSAQLQYNWNDKSQQIYDAITSLRIPEARKWLELEKKNTKVSALLHFTIYRHILLYIVTINGTFQNLCRHRHRPLWILLQPPAGAAALATFNCAAAGSTLTPSPTAGLIVTLTSLACASQHR